MLARHEKLKGTDLKSQDVVLNREYRGTLISAAVTGEIDVSEEPAGGTCEAGQKEAQTAC